MAKQWLWTKKVSLWTSPRTWRKTGSLAGSEGALRGVAVIVDSPSRQAEGLLGLDDVDCCNLPSLPCQQSFFTLLQLSLLQNFGWHHPKFYLICGIMKTWPTLWWPGMIWFFPTLFDLGLDHVSFLANGMREKVECSGGWGFKRLQEFLLGLFLVLGFPREEAALFTWSQEVDDRYGDRSASLSWSSS